MKMKDKQTLVHVKNLYRYYGNHCALENVSFDVKRGEVLGLLGPNGAGKSTCMQIIAGTLSPSQGEVLVNATDIMDDPINAKKQIGFLPEHPPVYRELTVNEYLDYVASIRGVNKKDIHDAVEKAKQQCGLSKTGERLIGNLSKGYQQRVGIAQAVIHQPAVVILDEPTVGLDPIQIREIRALIRELGGNHSVILCTHILPEVMAVCDRVQIIDNGRLVLNENIDTLNDADNYNQWKVVFANPPDISRLKIIPGIQDVELSDNGVFNIEFDIEQSPLQTLLEQAVSQQWSLQELTPVRNTLEEIFMQLTTSDTQIITKETAL
jgi:ABC-2 type transport system ATP-binding protein